MIILLLVLFFCKWSSFPSQFTEWLHKHTYRTSTGPLAHSRLMTNQGRIVAEKQFLILPSCLKSCNLEVTVYILIQHLLTWHSQNLREKHPVALFDIHTICIHKTDAWDNTENNRHDLKTSCYSLCAPCFVIKKRGSEREGEKRNYLTSFCSVLFAGD